MAAHLRRRAPAPLNPYVVLADVAINLMLIVCLLFVVSAHMRDAYFASKQAEFQERAGQRRALWQAKRLLKRSGQNLELRFRAEAWFEQAGDRLSLAGEELAQELAGLIVDPCFRGSDQQGHLFGQIHVTVTQGPATDPGLLYRRAQAIRTALEVPLRRAGHQWPFVASGRVQDLGDAGEPARDDVDIVITLRNPMVGST